MMKLWTKYVDDQDGFLESMAAAAQAVTDYFGKKEGIIYISVMNNMSIDCDCVDHPEPVKIEDYGIWASTDPVALDQACIDIINNQEMATSIEDRPPKPLKSATSWGIQIGRAHV